jgi:predicted transcriptional regulator
VTYTVTSPLEIYWVMLLVCHVRCSYADLTLLAPTVTNEHFIHEEVKRTFNSGSACYNSVQSLLSSCLVQKKKKT